MTDDLVTFVSLDYVKQHNLQFFYWQMGSKRNEYGDYSRYTVFIDKNNYDKTHEEFAVKPTKELKEYEEFMKFGY